MPTLAFHRSAVLGPVAGVLALLVSATAQAGGFEYPAGGARILGRGGAFVARADDPTALLYNPAALAWQPDSQLALNLQGAFLTACADRSGTWADNHAPGPLLGAELPLFGDDPSSWTNEQMPEVCNEGPVSPGGSSVAYTFPVARNLVLGFGVFSPSAVGHTQWGNLNGTVDTGGGLRPSPLRYTLIMERLLTIYPTIGAGYRVLPTLSVGATFQWGMASYEFINHAYADTNGEENLRSDIRSKLLVRDWFMPRLSAAVHWVPIDALDVAVTFVWSDAANAKGRLDLTTGAFTDQAALIRIEGVRLDAPQVSWAALGVRYADRIAPRPSDAQAVSRLSGRVEDAMANEWWDVELDVFYELAGAVDALEVTIPSGISLAPVPGNAPTGVRIPHEWKNQLGARLGGDYNILPGMAAVRAGVSYEMSGLDEDYAQIDFMPAERIGAHVGLTLRLGRWDINLAYAHLFQHTTEVSQQDAKLRLQAADPSGDASRVNAGTYAASFDAVALGVTWHMGSAQ